MFKNKKLQASLFFLYFAFSSFSKYITRSYCLLTVIFLLAIILNHKEINATVPSSEAYHKHLKDLFWNSKSSVFMTSGSTFVHRVV